LRDAKLRVPISEHAALTEPRLFRVTSEFQFLDAGRCRRCWIP